MRASNEDVSDTGGNDEPSLKGLGKWEREIKLDLRSNFNLLPRSEPEVRRSTGAGRQLA